MNKAVDLAQNRPLWSLMSTYGDAHSWCIAENEIEIEQGLTSN